MNCAIVEDEQLSIDLLTDYIARVPGLELASAFSSPLNARKYLESNPVDLLFQDIELPEISGLDLLKMLRSAPMTIVTSANSVYALESFEYLVLDYLLKPFSLGRFLQAVEKVRRLKSSFPAAGPRLGEVRDFLMIREGGQHLRLPHDRFLWVESYGEYVRIHTPERIYMPLMSMGHLEGLLPPARFVRIHRTRIVNLSRVDAIEGSVIRMLGTAHPIGRTYRAALLERLRGAAGGM